MIKKTTLSILALVVIMILGAMMFVPEYLMRSMNPISENGILPVSASADSLHNTLPFIADLHCDALLWQRDLLSRSADGHVDIPRMQAANVALQAFTVVTKAPENLNIEQNSADTDQITPIAALSRWPLKSLGSLMERARYQAEKLHNFADESEGIFRVIHSQTELAQFIQDRAGNSSLTAGYLGIEGAHPLEGKLEYIDVLYDAGFRMFGLTHFFDNEVGGSAHGMEKGPLTPFGIEVIKKMEEKNIIIDLAHASPALIDDVLARATNPIIVSHTGVKGTCNNTRNMSDAHMRGVAATGGVIGIGFWETAVCGPDATSIAEAIRYAVDLIGIEHVGLGSDYDGAIAAPFDISHLNQITQSLMINGFTQEEINLIMGGNVLRVLQTALPVQ